MLALALCAGRLTGGPGPAADEGTLTVIVTGAGAPGDSARTVTASRITRHALAPGGWYWSGGVQAENFFFANDRMIGLRRLQDYAAVLSVEYFQGAESVAALTVRPGWYFENRFSSAAWDIPVELITGVPLTKSLSGAVGFTNGRFYHHALPIFGVVWTSSPRLRFELVYPEPAVVFTLSPTMQLRLGGELTGTGFLSDARPVRTVVEYTSYRVGAEWSDTWRPGLRLALGAGVEAERDFDFFRRQGRVHGGGGGYLKISATYSR